MSSVVIGWLQLQRFEKEVSESPRGIACDCGEGGVCLGSAWGVSGVRLGCRWGAGGAQLEAQAEWKSYVFAGGKKCEGKLMTGERIFVEMLDALGMVSA